MTAVATFPHVDVTLADGATYKVAPMGIDLATRTFRRLLREEEWTTKLSGKDALLEAMEPVARLALSRHHSPDEVDAALGAVIGYGPGENWHLLARALHGLGPAADDGDAV